MLKKITIEMIDLVVRSWQEQSSDLELIRQKKGLMDFRIEHCRSEQIEQMRLGSSAEEGSIFFSEMPTDFERISDHILKIARDQDSIVR